MNPNFHLRKRTGETKKIMKLENCPKVSVIIPVFNSEKYIEKTFLSVMRQTYKDYEIIIIDDGSSDKTIDTVKKIEKNFFDKRVVILEQDHKGAGAARNLGILHAKADLIAFLDSDDIWFVDKLEKTMAVFDSETEVNLVAHDLIRIHPNGKKDIFYLHKKYNPRIDYFVNLYKKNCLVTSTVTVKKSILLEVGLFDNNFPPVEDYDLWLKMAHLVKPYYIKKLLGYYLIREGSQSENIDLRLVQEISVLTKHFPEFKKKHPFPSLILRKRKGQILGAVGKDWLLRKKTVKAVSLFTRALIQWPFNIKIYLYPLWVLYLKAKQRKKHESTVDTATLGNT